MYMQTHFGLKINFSVIFEIEVEKQKRQMVTDKTLSVKNQCLH